MKWVSKYVHQHAEFWQQKGAKNVHCIEKGSTKENITVMFTFSADVKTYCPVIVYPYKRIPEKI
jgi:hypothetical protein